MKESDEESQKRMNRRRFLTMAGVFGAAGLVSHVVNPLQAVVATSGAATPQTVALPFENGQRPLVQYPQKRMLIRHTTQAVQLETPFAVFNEGVLTPNDAFFVRYHNTHIPLEADAADWELKVGGAVTVPMTLRLADLKTQFPQMEVVAVNECSGNSRGLVSPRVTGGQWGNGAMGNARWKGVSLKAVLDRAGVSAKAVQVMFNGLDEPGEEGIPDFVKALDIDVARNGEVMLAYEMNGQDLPMLNGFPLRLVVPGYFGTYWVKHVSRIAVLTTTLDQFYMTVAYRIPDNSCACVPPGTAPTSTRPIGRLNVRSFITSLEDGAQVPTGLPLTVKGIAFDGGAGIKEVWFSPNGGANWEPARLGPDYGKYSFREWQAEFTPGPRGSLALQVKAVTNSGEVQPTQPQWNPSGYMRNMIETVNVAAI